MAIEVERKFLVRQIPEGCPRRLHIWQGYLQSVPERTVRVRIMEEAGVEAKAYLTLKGRAAAGRFARPEFEYAIPVADARILMGMCDHAPVEKVRHHYPYGGHLWEIDEFRGSNQGLLVAEIELRDEASEFEMPVFAGLEVTHDPRYLNVHLAYHPFTSWGPEKKTTSKESTE